LPANEGFDYLFAEEEWTEDAVWHPKTIARLRAQVIREFKEGRFNRDFENKLADRGIPLQAVLNTISSRHTYVGLYHDRYEGTRRIGFWHPRIQIFVAWKPGRDSQFKTAFDKETGLEYMRTLPGFNLIYRPEERKR
jgi:hypothetical protein